MKKFLMITTAIVLLTACNKDLPEPDAPKKDCFIIMAKGAEADSTREYYTLYRPNGIKDTIPYAIWNTVYFGQEYCK